MLPSVARGMVVAERVRAGETLTEVAQSWGISRERVRQLLRRWEDAAGVSVSRTAYRHSRRRITAAAIRQVAEQHPDVHMLSHIATLLGCSVSSVQVNADHWTKDLLRSRRQQRQRQRDRSTILALWACLDRRPRSTDTPTFGVGMIRRYGTWNAGMIALGFPSETRSEAQRSRIDREVHPVLQEKP